MARVTAGEPAPAAEAADVTVASDDDLSELDGRVRAHPQASLALVQLLRRTLQLDVAGSLWAESLVYSTLQAGPEFGAWLAGRERRVRPSSSGPAVGMRRSGGRLWIRLQRPEKRNAFSAEMRDGLAEALALLLRDGEIEEAVLCGEGPGFCSGGDLDEFGTLPDPATAHAIRMTRSPALLLSLCHGRVTARVHGACIGAGMELPAFCQRSIASEDATFEIPEVGMGLVPGAGGTASLPRRIGRQRCAWLGLSGRRIDAAEALAIGLVDEVVPEHPGP